MQIASRPGTETVRKVRLASEVHEHVKPLDGVRGLAVLLVIIPHLVTSGMLTAPAFLVAAVNSSAHGVDLFFVLSGFGLALPFLQNARGSASFDVATYAFNRVYRILPLYYLALAATFVLGYVLIHTGHAPPANMIEMPGSLYQKLAPLALFDRHVMPVDPGLWTVALQYRWYAVFPLFLLLWLRSPRAFWTVLVVAWAGYMFWRTRSMDLGTLPLFMLGIAAADIVAKRRRVAAFAGVALVLSIAIALWWDPNAYVPDPWGSDVAFAGQPTSFGWHVAAFSLVILAATWRPFQRTFAFPPLAGLGTASFSIYLVNQPVIGAVNALLGQRAGIVAFAAVIAVGFALYLCVERPLTNPAVRQRLRARALPFVKRILTALGVPLTFAVERRAANGRS